MKGHILVSYLSLLFMTSIALGQSSPSANFEQQAKDKAKQFATTLKAELQHAISEGGLGKGISVCHQRAPEIAQSLSTNGWHLARTSLKVRNPNNKPTDKQLLVLKEFERRKNAGEQIQFITKSFETNNEHVFMKAIPTGKLCLACHGSTRSEEVDAMLDKLYPNDKAKEFQVGDIRGAFVIRYLK